MTKERERNYFNVDIDIKDTPLALDIEDVFYIKDLKQRKLYINSVICSESVIDAIHHILQYNAEDVGIPIDQRKPILLYLTTNGGNVEAGWQLIDVIMSSDTPVYTINTGYWYSMGFLIGLAGHKRFATKNARFLMHDGSNFVIDSSSKVKDQIEFQKRMDDRTKKFVLNKSNIDEKEYDEKLRVEWYMFADEAKGRGVIDSIIGEDCSISEVV